jgi:hypothetical protein
MKSDLFEQRLSRQPLRPIPPAWRQEILGKAAASRPHNDPDPVGAVSARNWLGEWLWPHPAAWAGLAACWLAILTLDRLAAPSAAELAQARAGVPIAEAMFAASRGPRASGLTTQPAPVPAVDRPRRGPTDQGRLEEPPIRLIA